MSNNGAIPRSGELLKKGFGMHEVESVYDLMSCLQGPLSNSAFRRIVMLMLRGHYSSSANYPADMAHLGCYTWGPNGSLAVEFAHNFDDKHPDKVPGVFVGFGGVTLSKAAIGDHHSFSEDNSTEELVRSSKLTIRVHHVAKSLEDAMDLAELSQFFLLSMSKVVRNVTGAQSFEVMGYSEAVKNKLSSMELNYEVVLSVEISYTLAVALSEESHRIRVISLEIGSAS
jgi:hypothetical protein